MANATTRWRQIAIVGVASLAIWLSMGLLNALLADPEKSGTFGDSFGMVNSLFSGLAFACLTLTLFMQAQELGLQREEIRFARKEAAKSSKAQQDTAQLNAATSLLQHYVEQYGLSNKVNEDELFRDALHDGIQQASETLRGKMMICKDFIEEKFFALTGRKLASSHATDLSKLRARLWVDMFDSSFTAVAKHSKAMEAQAPAYSLFRHLDSEIATLVNKLDDLWVWTDAIVNHVPAIDTWKAEGTDLLLRTSARCNDATNTHMDHLRSLHDEVITLVEEIDGFRSKIVGAATRTLASVPRI